MEVFVSGDFHEGNMKEKEIFENIILLFCAKICETMGVTNLKQIYVPENFSEEVKEFQRKNNLPVGCTDDEFGAAFGKLIHMKDENENIYHVMFINTILCLGIINAIKVDIQDERAEIIFPKNLAAYTIKHEIAHAQCYNLSYGKEYSFLGGKEYSTFSILSQTSSTLWEEFYACKMAADNYDTESINGMLQDFKDTFKSIHISIQECFKQYQSNGEITNFFNSVHILIGKILIHLSYCIGVYWYDRLSEIKDCFVGLGLGDFIESFIEGIQILTDNFPNWQEKHFYIINEAINKFFLFLSITLEDRAEGFYVGVDTPFLSELKI